MAIPMVANTEKVTRIDDAYALTLRLLHAVDEQTHSCVVVRGDDIRPLV